MEIIVCNATQIRVEFKAAEVRGIAHKGSCWFELDGSEFKALRHYGPYVSPVSARRADNFTVEATKAACAKLEEMCTEAVRQWVAAGGMTAMDEVGKAERLAAVRDAEKTLEAALEAVAAATLALEAARKAAGV